jgi:hypothetical protein
MCRRDKRQVWIPSPPVQKKKKELVAMYRTT